MLHFPVTQRRLLEGYSKVTRLRVTLRITLFGKTQWSLGNIFCDYKMFTSSLKELYIPEEFVEVCSYYEVVV